VRTRSPGLLVSLQYTHPSFVAEVGFVTGTLLTQALVRDDNGLRLCKDYADTHATCDRSEEETLSSRQHFVGDQAAEAPPALLGMQLSCSLQASQVLFSVAILFSPRAAGHSRLHAGVPAHARGSQGSTIPPACVNTRREALGIWRALLFRDCN